tara:strand:+ start:5617 stop:6030 length:414 start_codon:yes stop_codon:yes gene_type:complete
MAFDARLVFVDTDGNEISDSIKVLQCGFGFTQNIDHLTGRPNARVRINNINLVVESSRDTQLADWMVTELAEKTGKIEFTIQNNISKTIEFEEAYCIQYNESFSYLGSESPMSIGITFSAMRIILDGNVTWVNHEGD